MPTVTCTSFGLDDESPFSSSARSRLRRRTAVSIVIAFAAAPFASAQFSPPQGVTLGVGVNPAALTGIVSGDLDGDGNGDILGVDNVSGGNIGVALGLPGGTYNAVPVLSGPLPASTNGTSLPTLGDFNLDGFLDVAVAGSVAGIPRAFVAAGSTTTPGTFTLPATSISLVQAGTATGLSVSDVTGDGRQDLLIAVIGPTRRVNTIPGNGPMTFGPLTSSTTATGPEDIDICVDPDNDGDKDLVICGFDSLTGQSVVEVMAGDGQGQFTTLAKVALPTPALPFDVHWIDCNQDHRYDIAVGCVGAAASPIFRLQNLGASPFFVSGAISAPFNTGTIPNALQRLDVNFDGVEDLAVFSKASSGTSVVQSGFEVLNLVNCDFVSSASIQGGTTDNSVINADQYSALTVNDQDGDGRQDVMIADQTGLVDRVLVYQNLGPADFTATPLKPLLGETTPFTFRLNAPTPLAGSTFAVLFSVAGTVPGIPLQGFIFPLNAPFLPIVLTGTLNSQGNGEITTPPVTFSTKPVGFSLQIASAAMVVSATQAGKIVYVSKPSIITVP